MADDDFDFDEIEEPTNSDWARARRAAKAERTKTQEAEATAAKATRELAFAKAGIPLDHALAPFFIAGYDGEMDPAAIKAKATEIGLVGGAATPPPVAQDQQQAPPGTPPASLADGIQDTAGLSAQFAAELDQAALIAQASSGGIPPNADPTSLIIDAFRTGGEEAMLQVIQNLGIPVADEGILR
jgi:hypothetical protein